MLDSWERYTSKSLRRISEKVTRNHINNRSSSNARVLVLRLRHSGNNREDFKVHLLLTAYLSLTSVDAASTHIALGKGARETIMTQNAVIDDFIIAGEGVGVVYNANRLNKPHPKLAKGVLIAMIAVRAAVVVNNIHTIQGIR